MEKQTQIKKLTVLTSTTDATYTKRAQALRTAGKINHIYAERAMWGVLFNQTNQLQIVTDGPYIYRYTNVIDLAKWAITHDIPTTILFVDSTKPTFKLTPVTNRVYADTPTPVQQGNRWIVRRAQTELPASTWQLVEEELTELKQYIQQRYLYESTIASFLENAEAWRLPTDQLNDKNIKYMEDTVAVWAPAYGIDPPQTPHNPQITPVQWRQSDPRYKLTPMTEEKLAIKQQLSNNNTKYLTDLYNAFRSIQYYRAESLPLLPDYVICPVCQRPLNTKGQPTRQIQNYNTGEQYTLHDTDIYCQSCGETFNEEQVTKLLDLKYIEENGSLDDQYTVTPFLQELVNQEYLERSVQ